MPLAESTKKVKLTPGFSCDGRVRRKSESGLYMVEEPCDARITLAKFYAVPDRRGWTLTRTGLAYCRGCTPKNNPRHQCPPPPPPAPPLEAVVKVTVRDGVVRVAPVDTPPGTDRSNWTSYAVKSNGPCSDDRCTTCYINPPGR